MAALHISTTQNMLLLITPTNRATVVSAQMASNLKAETEDEEAKWESTQFYCLNHNQAKSLKIVK